MVAGDKKQQKSHPIALLLLTGLLLGGLYACSSQSEQPNISSQPGTASLTEASGKEEPSQNQVKASPAEEAPSPALTATFAYTGDDVVDFCIEQPGLERLALDRIYQSEMNGPHDPQLDAMSEDQFINATQWYEGHHCADLMRAHPGLLETMRPLGAPLSDTRDIAWVAFNTDCKRTLNPTCIKETVSAFKSLQSINSGKEVAASRLCSLTLPNKVKIAQQWRCVELVGPGQSPPESTIQHCFGMIDRQEKADPVTAASKIKKCFSQGGAFGLPSGTRQ